MKDYGIDGNYAKHNESGNCDVASFTIYIISNEVLRIRFHVLCVFEDGQVLFCMHRYKVLGIRSVMVF